MKSIFFGVLILFTLNAGWAQTYEGTIVQSISSNTLNVDLYLKTTNGTSASLGDATFAISYNSDALTYVGKDAVFDGRWDNGSSSSYNDLTSSGFAPLASLDVTKTGSGSGLDIPTTATRVGRITFTITNASANSGIAWSPIFTFIADYAGNEITPSFSLVDPPGYPLPITLASFTATVVTQNSVRLDWTTLTETNNYGFEVQKSQGNQNNYQTIPNSFIPGHGTTIEPHSYSYIDNSASVGSWYYRLKQIDLDATVHFTEGIQVDVLTGVTEKPLPKEFALDQNFPNPFNPSTNIEYAVPRESRVQLVVYNVLGQQVATLVDEVKSAGYYTALFNATSFSSGLYFYRMNAGEVSFLKKMMLVK